jgi:cytochrome c-type biogenesis protein CcmH/NrfG
MRGISWDVILRQAPELMKLARELTSSSRDRSANIAAANDARALRDRLAELARDQQAHAALLTEITGQLDAITNASRFAADRARHALLAGGIGTVLGLVALLVALLR